ncbi:MAG: hydrogenase expression/formation protein [Promethearchaeota archaeon]|nr:MAG: hydrogenase expression/formation protein [Candidatus Lokiarchaeota archaeon]
MNIKDNYFPIGKLRHTYLNKLLKNHVNDLECDDKRIVLGSKLGEDAAVIDMGDKYLVAKTDPITFATDKIGYYVVNVNVNDLVCTGATPMWFQSTILLPEKKTTEQMIEKIFKSIHDTCKELNISVIGGHTEVTTGLKHPIIIGSLMGEVEKEKLVKTEGAEPGDALILTKGIFIEGTSIIGREKANFLREKGYSEAFIEKCKKYLYEPGISVLKEAVIANDNYKIKSLHDPTEGGLACGIAEMCIASNTGVLIEGKKIKILEEPKELSKVFKLNPLNTISSGSLLIAVKEADAEDLIEKLKRNKINAEKIGIFTQKDKGIIIQNQEGKKIPLEYSENDEILKIFKK